MIIEIHESFTAPELIPSDVRIVIESICLSARRGHHFLFAKRSVLNFLQEFPGITDESRVIIEGAKSSYSTTAGFLSQYGYRAVVRADINDCVAADGRWEVPMSSIVEHGVQPLNLLGENSRDAELYLYAARHYIINNKIGGISIYAVPRNGNGNGTSIELKRYIDEQREWVLCITDSDRNSPDGAIGSVAQMCAAEAGRKKWVAEHAAVLGRTIENVLPFNIVSDAVPKDLAICLQEVTQMQQKHGAVAVFHANLKDGVCARWIRNMKIGTPARKFWTEIAGKDGVDCEECCAQQQECAKVDQCQKFIVRGYGSNLPGHVKKHLTEISAHQAAGRARTSFNFQLWDSIGKIVCAMAMAPKPLRS